MSPVVGLRWCRDYLFTSALVLFLKETRLLTLRPGIYLDRSGFVVELRLEDKSVREEKSGDGE